MPQYFKRKISKIETLLKPLLKYGLILVCIGFIFRLLFSVDLFLKENNISKEFIKSIIFNTDVPILKYQGRTNIAVLGIVGGSHEGSDLTDTILFLSIDYQKKDVVLISLPRDIWMENLKDKINSAYHYGEIKQKGGGILLAKSEVEEITGQPVHYAALINLVNLEKLIDLVGGIDVYVDKPFTDNYYPIAGKENDLCGGDPTYYCRYEKLIFEKKWYHMSGETVSKYVRSRYAEGDEGTDFARNRRQQQIIIALKDKIIQSSLWKNPTIVKKLIEIVNGSILTDMQLSEKMITAKLFLSLKDQSIRRILIDDGDEQKKIKGFLETPPVVEYNGAWVLIPRTGNFDEIHKYVSCQLQDPICAMKP